MKRFTANTGQGKQRIYVSDADKEVSVCVGEMLFLYGHGKWFEGRKIYIGRTAAVRLRDWLNEWIGEDG